MKLEKLKASTEKTKTFIFIESMYFHCLSHSYFMQQKLFSRHLQFLFDIIRFELRKGLLETKCSQWVKNVINNRKQWKENMKSWLVIFHISFSLSSKLTLCKQFRGFKTDKQLVLMLQFFKIWFCVIISDFLLTYIKYQQTSSY